MIGAKRTSTEHGAGCSRTQQHVQELLDATFALIDERGTTGFTIQEGANHSEDCLREFNQYSDGKDDLLFALLEQMFREALADLRDAVASESEPLGRLRAFTIRLHEWCETLGTRRKRGALDRSPVSELSSKLAVEDPERLAAVTTPILGMLVELLETAVAAGSLRVDETRQAALLIQQAVMLGLLTNHVVANPRARVTAKDVWEFCLHGLGG